MSIFSLRLRELRKEKGVTQEAMGNLMKLQRGTFSAYERGKIVPPFDKIKWLADYFNVSVDYLMGSSNLRNYTNKPAQKNDIKDVYEQLDEIRKELISESIRVKMKGKELNVSTKKLMLSNIENSIAFCEVLCGTIDK